MMQTRFKIIDPNMPPSLRSVVMAREPSYDALREILDPIFHGQRKGARFERVSVLGDEDRPADMFVDDDGIRFGLLVNLEATKVYHRASIARGEKHENGIIRGASCIHGVAVLFERRVWF